MHSDVVELVFCLGFSSSLSGLMFGLLQLLVWSSGFLSGLTHVGPTAPEEKHMYTHWYNSIFKADLTAQV